MLLSVDIKGIIVRELKKKKSACVTRQNMVKGKQADMACDVVNQRPRRSDREKTTSSWRRDFVWQ